MKDSIAGLVHAIESEMLDVLPGEKKIYLPWQQLHSCRVATSFSPLNAIPYISRFDAGTLKLAA